jgi:hypothetical protein
MSEAQICGVDIPSISRICNGKQIPKKFIFKYDEESIKEPLDDLLYFLN